MVFTKPLDQSSGGSCWTCMMMNIRCNESDLQTYLQKVPLAQGFSA